MNEFETITYVIENNVATISLNLPKTMNAFSKQMRLDLKRAIDASDANNDVRVVVLRAEGKGFSSGTDLTQGLAGFKTIEEQIIEEYKPILMSIVNSNKPYIASVQGACAGIGASIALSCDLGVMAEGAFLYVPFAGISLVPDGGMAHFLVTAMGYKRAYQMFLESGRMQSDECLQYGLVNKVVEADKLVEATNTWAKTLAKGAPLSQKFGKQIMRQVHTSTYEETVDLEAKLQNNCFTSKDTLGAIDAFFKKKKPVFIGV
jgi:2-(1,2-epoxy-1,2-dihydrophenyl)acetyl-CoA isomerase